MGRSKIPPGCLILGGFSWGRGPGEDFHQTFHRGSQLGLTGVDLTGALGQQSMQSMHVPSMEHYIQYIVLHVPSRIFYIITIIKISK